MIRYIPDYILYNYEKNILKGNIRGYVLLFDIADFTKIGTALQKEGKRGAEELSRFLEEVFGEPIKIVERQGGFVSLFAGDAFCALFPDGKSESIISAVNSIQAFFKEKSVYQTSFGDFDLKIRLTISCGDIKWQIFENEVQNEYIFYGETMRDLAELSGMKEDVIFSETAAGKIGEERFEKLDKGYRPVADVIVGEDKSEDSEAGKLKMRLDTQSQGGSERTKNHFICSRLRNEKPDNEIRSAAYCFVNLENVDFADRKETIAVIERLADSYGGYVNKLDATDKGLISIVLFGMPLTVGNTLDRICRFSLDTLAAVPHLSLGISSGSVFAGYTGSGEVREYTALGHPVNLSARLMSEAKQGEVLADSYLYRELANRYRFHHIGAINLKGISYPIEHYLLQEMSSESVSYSGTSFVGRDQEQSLIQESINESLKGKNNVMVYVLGDAGVGKSRLISEVLELYPDNDYHKYFVYCDAILQKSLEPIKQLVRSFFCYNPAQTTAEGLREFRDKWVVIAEEDAELLRIESIIASLLGYEWEGSVWNMLPPEEKPNQLQNAFIRFAEEIAAEKPVILHLDDGQWIDEGSKEYLQKISDSEVSPFVILSSCRYLESGDKPDLELANHLSTDINLNTLTEDGSKKLAESILGLGNVPEETLVAINHRAAGNPFFIEQLISYLRENDKLSSTGVIVGELDSTASFSINDVIGGRIDRLTERVRECISNASVLGREFDVQVLSKMLNRELQDEFIRAQKSRIWYDLDELRYIFSHILIKDVVYNRMMNEKLQTLHQIAASAMETVYADNLDENAEEIAMHFDKAREPVKAADYYDKAGCYYLDRFEFDRSEENLRKGLDIRKRELGANHQATSVSLNNLGSLYLHQGNYEEAESAYIQSFNIKKKVLDKDHPDTATVLCNLGTLYYDQAKYDLSEPLLKKALEIRERAFGEQHPDTAYSLLNLAMLYYYRANYNEAELLFLRSLKIAESVLGEEHSLTADSLCRLADQYRDQGKYHESEKLYLRSLKIREKVLGEKHPVTAGTLNNLAELYRNLGKYAEAEPIYFKSLKITEQILGEEHLSTAISLNNLALLFSAQGRFAEAEPLYVRSLRITEKVLGCEHPDTARGLQSLGVLYREVGRYDEAEAFYLRSLKIFEKVLGEDHPDLATGLQNLATIYRTQKKFDKAEPLFLRSLKIFEQSFGAEHLNTAVSLINMAGFYRDQERYDEAEPLYLQAIATFERILGDQHPKTAVAYSNLAELYSLKTTFDKAEILFHKALSIMQIKLGEKHQRTTRTIKRIINLYEKTGDEEKAEEYRKMVNSEE